MKVEIKNNVTEDAKKLRNEVFVLEQGFSPSDEFTGDDYLYKHIHIYNDDILIAYSRFAVEDDSCHLGRILVRKEYRMKGIGKYLMEETLKEAFKYRNKCILHSQAHAVGFYLKCGFKVEGDVFIEAGHEHYKMVINKE